MWIFIYNTKIDFSYLMFIIILTESRLDFRIILIKGKLAFWQNFGEIMLNHFLLISFEVLDGLFLLLLPTFFWIILTKNQIIKIKLKKVLFRLLILIATIVTVSAVIAVCYSLDIAKISGDHYLRIHSWLGMIICFFLCCFYLSKEERNPFRC